jgi:pantetheine-phosphate adenylyltransferase
MNIAVYAGSFDPVTLGHINIVERGLHVFERIIIGVAVNPNKKGFFTAAERVEMIREIFKGVRGVKVEEFTGLLVAYAKKVKANAILRGIRSVQDFEYEFPMALANKKLLPNVETVFMMTEGEYSYFSSSLIKEICTFGGNIHGMVPKQVEKRMLKKCRETAPSKKGGKKGGNAR